MTPLNPLARPRIALVIGAAEDARAVAFTRRGMELGIRSRLPLAQIAEWPAADVDGVLATPGAVVDSMVPVVTLPDVSPALLCTAALPDELRSRRLALLRRLGWIPEGPIDVITDGSVASARAIEQARRARPDLVAVDAGNSLPPSVSVDDLAALVAEAAVCVATDPILTALAVGAGRPVATRAVAAALGKPRPTPRPAGLAALEAALDRLATTAVESWEPRGRPGDVTPSRASARMGALLTTRTIELAVLRTRLANTEARLREAEAELASVHHSRTWRYSRALLARRRPTGR